MTEPHDTIEAEGTFTFEDLLHSLYWYFCRARAWSLLLILFIVADVLGFTLAGAVADLRQRGTVTWQVATPVTVGLIVVVAILLPVQLRLRRQRRRGATIHYSVSSSGLACTTPETRSQMAWRAFKKAIELKGAFLLVLDSGAVVVLPHRILQADQVPALRQLLGEQMPVLKPRGLVRTLLLMLLWAAIAFSALLIYTILR
ncbi:MAG TPA: YcxB family protein [Thermoanaerobaculia bacterium]|nr:YcxB family protein [Thermoanaerobaculia bacterium]